MLVVFGVLEALFKSGTVANLAIVAWTIYTKVGGRTGWQVLYNLGDAALLKNIAQHLPNRMLESDLWVKVSASLPHLVAAIKAWREARPQAHPFEETGTPWREAK